MKQYKNDGQNDDSSSNNNHTTNTSFNLIGEY